MTTRSLLSRLIPALAALSLGLAVTVAADAAPGSFALPIAKTSPKSAPIGAGELADRVQQFYDQTKTFKASFKQRYYIAAYNKFKDSNGQVTFQKPGKMSWRYKNNGNRVVSDGKTIKVYEKDNKQMFQQSITKSQYPAALSFLIGGGKLRSEFNLTKLDAAALKFEGGYVLRGIPKKPTPAFQQMLLYVDGSTFQVRRVLMIDAQRNRNRFDFENPVVNQAVAPAEFTFHPPAGTQVIKP